MNEQKLKGFVEKLMANQQKFHESFRIKPGEECLKLDLSIAHVMVLKLLSVKKEHPILTDLAKNLSISPPMMTHIIDKLETAGLAKRTRDKSDRRIIRVELTAKGKSITIKMDREFKEKTYLYFKSLDSRDQEALVNAMNVLMDIMSRNALIM